ncbi:hypothetical protein BDZ89DRAFT_1076881 [Hymenopellis radicata]|nr:hypothetical protein BDZ89DRAFT_1076881 [Hymenopellis radicata]
MSDLITTSDAHQWATASLVQTNVEYASYGVYATAVLMSLVLLIHNGLRTSYARSVLFLTMLVMFGISTAHVYLRTTFYGIQFLPCRPAQNTIRRPSSL